MAPKKVLKHFTSSSTTTVSFFDSYEYTQSYLLGQGGYAQSYLLGQGGYSQLSFISFDPIQGSFRHSRLRLFMASLPQVAVQGLQDAHSS